MPATLPPVPPWETLASRPETKGDHLPTLVWKRTRSLLVLGLVAVLAVSAGACGDDDDGSTGSGSGDEAAAPPPSTAFNDLTTALEGQGLVVAPLPKGSLDGAQAGVKISGEKDGTGRSFASATKARDYADRVEAGGDKTTIVGTVVFAAPTQKDADFFADAYEG